MSARSKMVLLLLMVWLGATSWKLFASRSRIAPEEMLLARWRYAAKTVRNVQGTVTFYHYDSPWPDKQSEGRFWYTAEHRGAFFHRPLPPDFAEDWTYLEWDEQHVKIIDNHRRTITVMLSLTRKQACRSRCSSTSPVKATGVTF